MDSIVDGAGAVVVDPDGRLLLVRRAHDPYRGRWSVPGGRVEPGETFGEAAVREVREETGLEVRADRELWRVRIPAGRDVVYDVRDVAATVVGGRLVAGDDASEVRWVAPDDVASLRLAPPLADCLRDAGLIPLPPLIDEQAVEIAAGADAAWRALLRVVEHLGGPRLARLLGCDDVRASGPRPFAAGSAVPCFHALAADPPNELRLAGRHRYSDYVLTFRITPTGPGRCRLSAESLGGFPGATGAAYRALVVGSGMHRLATRRMLVAVRRSAESNRGGRSPRP